MYLTQLLHAYSQILLLEGKTSAVRSLILVDLRDFIYLFAFSAMCFHINMVDKERSKDSALHLKQKVQRFAKSSLIHH